MDISKDARRNLMQLSWTSSNHGNLLQHDKDVLSAKTVRTQRLLFLVGQQQYHSV